MKDRLIGALADKRDLERQLIGLKQVVEEFMVRLDFMLKCQASPEACLRDLQDLGFELSSLVNDVSGDKRNDRISILVELSKSRHENESLREENSNLQELVDFLENTRVDEADSSRKIAALESKVADHKEEISVKEAEIETLKLSHEVERKRMEQTHGEECIKLKGSLSAANRIVERWKKIYHEDMVRLQSRIGNNYSTVSTKQSS